MKRTSNIIIVLGVKGGAKIPAASAKRKQAGPPKSESFGGETKKEETKIPSKAKIKKTVKELVQKPKKQNWVKRIFRRKSM